MTSVTFFGLLLRLIMSRMNKDLKTAFNELIARQRNLIWHVCSDYSLSAAWEVEDAVQEVLCALWRNFEDLADWSKERAWTYRIATSTMLDIKRKAYNRPQLSEAQIPDQVIDNNENYSHLMQLINNLDEIDQMIVRAHLDNFHNYEIAQMTGLSIATIGRRLKAIIQLLRVQFEE